MISSQPLVIGWIEFVVAGTILLAATNFIVVRHRQRLMSPESSS